MRTCVRRHVWYCVRIHVCVCMCAYVRVCVLACVNVYMMRAMQGFVHTGGIRRNRINKSAGVVIARVTSQVATIYVY